MASGAKGLGFESPQARHCKYRAGLSRRQLGSFYCMLLKGSDDLNVLTFSAALLVFSVLGLGIAVSKKVGNVSDYTVAGKKAGVSGVVGVIMGALMGGASTVGTVQMAYKYGLSAWWFTLGGGVGCIILGLGFASRLREANVTTIPGFLKKNYGMSVSIVSMIASSLGTYIAIVAQFLSGVALLQSILPLSPFVSAMIVVFFVLGFLYLGGLKSYSLIGKVKIIMLFLTLGSSAALIFIQGATPLCLIKSMPSSPFFNFFGAGISKGIGAFFSMIVGVFCTQIYLQGIFAASDPQVARRGALLAGVLIPPLGLMGVYIGLYMRSIGGSIDPAHALPIFIRLHFPPVVGGVFLAGIFITVVGAAAGLSFGVATNLVQDFLNNISYISQRMKGAKGLLLSRATVAVIVVSAACLGIVFRGDLILNWSYLSMSLRGVGTFLPLIVALLYPGALSPFWAFLSAIAGLGAALMTPLFSHSVEPLFVGLLLSGILTFVGLFVGR